MFIKKLVLRFFVVALVVDMGAAETDIKQIMIDDDLQMISTSASNYALSGKQLTAAGVQAVSVTNGNNFVVCGGGCDVSVSSTSNLPEDTRTLIADLKTQLDPSSMMNNSSTRNGSRSSFIFRGDTVLSDNNSQSTTCNSNGYLIHQTAKNSFSVSKEGLPNNLERIFVTDRLTTLVFKDGTVQMKPNECLQPGVERMLAPIIAIVRQVGMFRQILDGSGQKLSRQVENASDRMGSRVTQLGQELNRGQQEVYGSINQRRSTGESLSDETLRAKLLASLVLFVITLLCGYLPVRMILNQSYIEYAMFAGGGVLMATAFCHLIPETHNSYKQASLQHSYSHAPAAGANGSDGGADADDSEVPYVEITLCCGFFFMYLVEQLMVRFVNEHTHNHLCDASLPMHVGDAGDSSNCAPSDQRQLASANGGRSSTTSSAHGLTPAGGRPTSSTATDFYKFIRGLLIVSAFIVHSIFDGVAIGSQETTGRVWTIFLAICCHKLIIAAVLGMELYAATFGSHLWTLVHLSIFSIMSPIGIILVVLAQNSLHLDSDHSMILLQSFATGTLLYVIFVEILQPNEGKHHAKNKFGKSFSMITGFVLMLLVLTLISDD